MPIAVRWSLIGWDTQLIHHPQNPFTMCAFTVERPVETAHHFPRILLSKYVIALRAENMGRSAINDLLTIAYENAAVHILCFEESTENRVPQA